MIRSLGAHDTFSALIMESAGLEMAFLGGFGASASRLGMPDVGLMTLTEMTDAVRHMAERLSIPVVADGDTGHGDLPNVVRTVREFERAGAAGLLLEDQVNPKRCGHFAGKQVIAGDEMVLKLKAALDARRDPDFVIIARTDARAVEGFDAALERAHRYREAGADVGFVEAPQSLEELRRVASELGYPQLANMLVGGLTPILNASQLEQLGFKIAVEPVASLLATAHAVRQLTRQWLQTGRVDELASERLTFEEIKELLGLPSWQALRSRFDAT